MWQALREEALLRANEARRRAQQVAAAAREILEDARAAIEADDEDETPAAARAGDSKDDESMTVSVLPRSQLPINQERDSKCLSQKEPFPSLAPELESARPVSRTESASALTRGPTNLSETSQKPSGSFPRPFSSSPDVERGSSSRRRPKIRGLGAMPLGTLSASTGSSSADHRGEESTDLDDKRRLALQAECTTSQTGPPIEEENPSLDHALRLEERGNPAIHEREGSALTATRLVTSMSAQREGNHGAEEETSVARNDETDDSTVAVTGAATPMAESLSRGQPLGRQVSSALDARSEARPTTTLASMNVQQRNDVDALLFMDGGAPREHFAAGTDAGASEWKRPAERSPDIPEQALENPMSSMNAYANTCVDRQASGKVDDAPREEAILGAAGFDREEGIRALSTMVETSADAQGSNALLCAPESSTHDVPFMTLDERKPSCPSTESSAASVPGRPTTCRGSEAATSSNRERRTEKHRPLEDTDLQVVVDRVTTMKQESADDLGLLTQPLAGHSPRTASVFTSSTEIEGNAAIRSEPFTSPVAARNTVTSPMSHRNDDSATAEPEPASESKKLATLPWGLGSERFLIERQGESIPSDKSTSESASPSMRVSQRVGSWNDDGENDTSAGAISEAPDKNDESHAMDEQNAETLHELNISKVFGPRLTSLPQNAPALATPASSPPQEHIVSPGPVAATDISYAEVRQVPEESEEFGSEGCRARPVATPDIDTTCLEKVPCAHQTSSKAARESCPRIATSIPLSSEHTIAGAALEHADRLTSDHARLEPEETTAACSNPSEYAVLVAQRPSDVLDASANADRQTIQALRDQLAALTDRLAASQDLAEQWACRYEELRTDYECVSAELEKLREHCLEQESNLESLQEALDHALAQLRDAQNESQTSRAAEAEAQAALTDLQRSMAVMEQRLLEHDERERKLSRALTAMQQSHEASLERREQQHQTQLRALEARVLAMESTAADTQQETARLRSLLEQSEAQLLFARGEQARLVDELAECRAALEEAQTRNARLRQERNCWKLLLLRHHYRTMLEATCTEHEREPAVVANVASATDSMTSTTDRSHTDSEHAVVPEPIDIDQVVESTSADEPIDRPFLRQLLLVFLQSDQPSQRQEALDLLLRLLQCTEAERARVAQNLLPRRKRVSLGREFVRFLWRETEPDPGSRDTSSAVN